VVANGKKLSPWIHDPNDVLDYVINWTSFLSQIEDTIVTSTWIVPTGITKNSQEATTTTTKIWLSGGIVGTKYGITNRIETAGGRTVDQTVYVKVKEQ